MGRAGEGHIEVFSPFTLLTDRLSVHVFSAKTMGESLYYVAAYIHLAKETVWMKMMKT